MVSLTVLESEFIGLKIEGSETIPLEVGVVTEMSGYPEYEGSYEITPSTSVQTLSTANRHTVADFIINPIPQNYGLITWNGSTLTVS